MRWEPARADHSIDRVLVAFKLSNTLDANTFDELVVAARKAAGQHKLTNRIETLEPIEVPATQGLIRLDGMPNASPRRVHFQRLDNEGKLVEEFSVGMQRIAFATLRYRRWQNFFHLVTSNMDAIFKKCPTVKNIKAVRLEYIDRFVSPPGGADHFEVIFRASKYLAPIVTEKSAALHVHSGWFDFPTNKIRQLTNVNIDVHDIAVPPPPDPRRKIAVLTMSELEALEGGLDDPMQRLDAIHDYLKLVYRSIITPEAATRVALND